MHLITKPPLSPAADQRVATAVACHDTSGIPKVPGAGDVVAHASGECVQVMHNGIVVLADRYYNQSATAIIKALHGHHEPQEEKVFHAVLGAIGPGAVMVELGAYWSYYSLWFQQAVRDGVSYLVEPDESNLRCGEKNFQLNGKCGKFIRALVGEACDEATVPPTITVDHLVQAEKLHAIDILHSDIQGAEYRMLLGCQQALKTHRVRFVFVSTHGLLVHHRCLRYLKRRGFFIVASHTRPESFSDDGLIVATCDRDYRCRVAISKRPVSVPLRLKSILARLAATFLRDPAP